MDNTDKTFYFTFFTNTIWTTTDDDDDTFLNLTHYTENINDDLGWKKIYNEAYWKSFNTKTLSKIVNDFTKIDFGLIKKLFQSSRRDIKKEIFNDQDFNEEMFDQETESNFKNFVNITKKVIQIYQDCIDEKKDLILDYT